jgi:predicted amidohydrolase YtcJ
MKIASKVLLITLSFSLMMQACRDLKNKADLIIYNATVYTVDSVNNKAESIAVKDGKIIAVGTDAEVRSRFSAIRMLDAKKQFVYPGFIDAHSHFSGFGLYLRYADLTAAGSFDEVLEIIKKYHTQNPGSWIVGRGWDQNKWPGKKFPDKTKLDVLYPEIPVVLTRIDGHAVLANTAAVKRCGLSAPFPEGQAILSGGNPTGVFLERCADKIRDAIPAPTPAETSKLLLQAMNLCHAAGLTGVNDAGIDKVMVLFIDSLQKAGKLNLRIDAMINPSVENMDFFMPGGGYKTDFLRVGSVKIYADGALGSRGACLLQPYSDDLLNHGILVSPASEIRRICQKADKYGFQVNTHAIGDSAVRTVLNVYGEFLKGKNDLRWRIEHAQVVDENDFGYFGRYSIIPSVQATHATSDMAWAGDRLGKSRLKNAYAYHRLMMENGWIANGTDFPIENISPVLTFYAAVARKNLAGKPEAGFMPENALSRLEALKSITIWAAKASFQENRIGSIEVGKFADFTILDSDILNVGEADLPKSVVKFTIVGGDIVHQESGR